MFHYIIYLNLAYVMLLPLSIYIYQLNTCIFVYFYSVFNLLIFNYNKIFLCKEDTNLYLNKIES